MPPYPPILRFSKASRFLSLPYRHFVPVLHPKRAFSFTRIMATEFKLKDLASLPALSPGDKEAYEVEGIEGAKVLLLNAGGIVQATGAKCTHYGAPLAKGVLTKDGRLTCPWHGGETLHPYTYGLRCILLVANLGAIRSLLQC